MRLQRAGALAALAGLLATLLILLAACGGSDDSGVAEAEGGSGGGNGTTATTTTPASEEEAEQAALDFARCMREQGVDFPDPQPDEDGGLQFRAPEGADPEALRDASEKCEEHLEGIRPELSEEDQAELQDAQLEFARCMRAEGVDVPDPQPGAGPGGGTLFQLDEDDPKVEAALEKCEPIIRDALPQGGGD
jgi:hypothetical protein